MKYPDVHDNRDLMLLQCISGSRAYGLDTAQSDTDIRGVFCLPQKELYGLQYTEQVANETNDIVYYELGRFIELLLRNNPNILELLASPEDAVLFRHPVMRHVRAETFLSKLCRQTFAGYAQTQIKKAKGLNKKIFNPVSGERKSVIDFCFVISGYRSQPLERWLGEKGFRQEDCGLVSIAHARDVYALFHKTQVGGRQLAGVFSGELANDVRLSSIPEEVQPLAIISFNKDGYSTYCKDFREYHEWVEKRNDARFQHNTELGKNYDAKNMMHTFRLLHMAAEIASEGSVNVRRNDREFLFRIRNGQFSYEELVTMANEKMQEIDRLFDRSDLPEAPDPEQAEQLLVKMREEVYFSH